MATFQISSKGGADFGVYQGETAAEAFAAMVADGDGEIGSPEVGTAADWIIQEVAGMTNFLGSTIALECNGHDLVAKSVRVEFERAGSDVALQPVSGRDMSKMPGRRVVSADEYAVRPADVYDSAVLARWALRRCGWTLMSEDRVE